jgi:hypothetical protein
MTIVASVLSFSNGGKWLRRDTLLILANNVVGVSGENILDFV